MAGISCVVMGNESLLVHCTEMLLSRGNTVAAVITRNSSIRDWARDRGLRVEQPGKDLAARLGGISCDWLLSIANLDIIPEDVLAMPQKGAINFHDGPLPRHAGLNAPIWALIEGETQHGITWHLIQSRVDEGDILVQHSFDISPQDTALTLNTKAYETALRSFPSLLDQLETDALSPVSQDLNLRSYHALSDRPAGHGMLDFARPAQTLERLVRALDHGAYWNPLSAAKFRAKDQVWLVGKARLTQSHASAGTVLDVGQDQLTVACGENALVLSGLTRICGLPVDPAQIAQPGDVLPALGDLAQIDAAIAKTTRDDSAFRTRLADFQPAELVGLGTASEQVDRRALDLPGDAVGLIAHWAARLATADLVDIAYRDPEIAALAQNGLISDWAPLRLPHGSIDQLTVQMNTALEQAKGRSFTTDIAARAPELEWPSTPALGLSYEGHIQGTALTVIMGESPQLSYHTGRVSPAMAELLAARLELLAINPDQRLPAHEREMVLHLWNATAADRDETLTMHRAFEAQVATTPDALALIFEDQHLSYAELNSRANRAAHLLRDMGVAPGQVVGLCCNRSVDLMVGALAILKAGGAYLPMDPAYPADRLQHFVEDSQARVIVTQAGVEPHLPPHRADLLVLDAEPRLMQAPDSNLPDTASPDDLAYLIYTSGSTGKPKGVMIEHRNVLNFYTGMDAHVPHAQGGTWLAVTSLSFDISVLELFWTTARGLTVVLSSDEDRGLISKGPMPMSDQAMQFSIYYWGNDDGVGRDKYTMLLEGAKFADEHGFVAVWTPERHFHAFGGPYPNPSVTGAAVAAVTRNIGVRSGSVVAPLHHPARIAEEWSVIDNLTNGRAGLAIASGWQPDDFVLRPENTPPNNKPAMMENIDQIRRLWRGEPVGFPRQDGTLHEVVTQPRPVSKEVPIWVTTAGNPETWREAGRTGCHVLTHLLGQSIEEVAGKIKIYHQALREAGHNPKDFTVTLMLHTFISDTREHAREIARQPMKDYLNAAAGLIKQYAWAFPAFKRPEGVNNAFDLQLDVLEPDELDAILEFAFERYFNESGLFGTVDDAMARVDELTRIGVTEIACLIDYGIERQTVLDGLKPLAEVVQRAQVKPELAADDFSVAAQIVRHEVTHLQCTPSMARMIAMNDEARFALRGVQHLFLGGEPLPGALVREFSEITDAPITNMYGPTETTIWSSVQPASAEETIVNVGLPLANQQLYVLDPDQHPVGIGQEGELWIGGDGVTRGYWNRDDLTADRFRNNPFQDGRMYRTGDLVRRREDGRIDFIGRVDHQVKLRGFRIELGEIEGALEALPAVSQAVVMVREDTPGDQRLVGYYTGAQQDESEMRTALGKQLPFSMVPGRMVHLPAFPLTPNKKVDRKALPAPAAPVAPKHAPKPAPTAQPIVQTTTSGQDGAHLVDPIARIWSGILGVSGISAGDNFFDLGGHSLLAVQAHRAIREELGASGLSITDIFRFPVLSDLSDRVAQMVGDSAPREMASPAPAANERARSRSEAMSRRREMRARRKV